MECGVPEGGYSSLFPNTEEDIYKFGHYTQKLMQSLSLSLSLPLMHTASYIIIVIFFLHEAHQYTGISMHYTSQS